MLRWRSAAVRLLLAWGVLSALALGWARPLLAPMLPLAAQCAQLLLPAFASQLHDDGNGLTTEIVGTFSARENIRIVEGFSLDRGRKIEPRVTLIHHWVPVVILNALLWAVPVIAWRQRLLLITLGVALSPLLISATLAVHLTGLIELSFSDVYAQAGVAGPQPWLLDSMIFLEGGGNWLLPVLLALGCAQMVARHPGTVYFSSSERRDK